MDAGSDRKQAPSARSNSRSVLGVLILCAFCGAGYLLSQTKSTQSPKTTKNKKQAKWPAAVPVAIAKVTRGSISEDINALGAVTPLRTVSVTSRVAGS
jgi:multidrug efflux pump subunit AcrA (membrane-fusion protein)